MLKGKVLYKTLKGKESIDKRQCLRESALKVLVFLSLLQNPW